MITGPGLPGPISHPHGVFTPPDKNPRSRFLRRRTRELGKFSMKEDRQMTIFVSGGTGYMGSNLIPKLLMRGHLVHALVRAGSERKVAAGCVSVVGDALNSASFAARVPEGSVFVHLLGTPRPAPWKGKQFRAIDIPSVKASLAAALAAKVSHFVYVSVAHPAPIMKAYI